MAIDNVNGWKVNFGEMSTVKSVARPKNWFDNNRPDVCCTSWAPQIYVKLIHLVMNLADAHAITRTSYIQRILNK